MRTIYCTTNESGVSYLVFGVFQRTLKFVTGVFEHIQYSRVFLCVSSVVLYNDSFKKKLVTYDSDHLRLNLYLQAPYGNL